MSGADRRFTNEEAAAKMAARAAALQPQNMQRFMESQAKKWQDATIAAFAQQRSPAGEPFPKLAASTLAGRARDRTKGALTSTGRPFRRPAARPGLPSAFGTLALVKSRTMMRTTRYVPEAGTIKLSTVDYMRPHQSGAKNGRPPKRNVLVYQRVGGKLQLVEPYGSQFRQAFLEHVEGVR